MVDVAIRRKFPFLYKQPDIPLWKAKIVARLDIMKLDGWRALESMTIAELDALQEEAESAAVYIDEYNFVGTSNPHDKTICEAREAIKKQRLKTRQKLLDKETEQIKRRNALIDAAQHIREAASLIEQAHSTELDPSYYERLLPRRGQEIDPPTMTDGELKLFLRECDPQTIGNPLPDFSLFAMLDMTEAEEIASELKRQNEAHRERIETMRANRTAAREELERRKENKATSEKRTEEVSANLGDVIAELQERIEELEAGR